MQDVKNSILKVELMHCMFESYQKLDAYLDQMLSVILVMTFCLMVVNGVIQSFVLTNKGWDASLKMTLIITATVAFIFLLVCVFMYSFGNHQQLDPRAYFMPLLFFVFSSIVLVGFNYGINIFTEFDKTRILHKKELLVNRVYICPLN